MTLIKQNGLLNVTIRHNILTNIHLPKRLRYQYNEIQNAIPIMKGDKIMKRVEIRKKMIAALKGELNKDYGALIKSAIQRRIAFNERYISDLKKSSRGFPTFD